MNNTPATAGRPEWVLADFLSTYRYWALFFSSLLVASASQGLSTILPLMAQKASASYQMIGVFYFAINLGWILGAFVAFVAASRHGWLALVVPLVIHAVTALAFMLTPDVWGSTVFLTVFGMVHGMSRAVFPLAIAIFLVGGRPNKIDFGCALTLISASILVAFFAPAFLSMLYQFDDNGTAVITAFLTCIFLALILLLPARPLAFEEVPRVRHKPITPRRRSPFLVAIMLSLLPVLVIVLSCGLYLAQENWLGGRAFESSPAIFLISMLILAIALTAFVYLAYWTYRIHGELAGAAASQRLLTPLAGMFISILIPLGLPILIMTLGDLLNDRARSQGEGRLVSITWLAIWSLILPPIALAMIQNAANNSYEMGAGAA
ncbi:hypothetical protein KX729_07110 [Rhizobium sp. XQZ8]|uniref:hypothetical protein n=1 Tax=Rhizobium populisoli TaxID=2859785 RepID=UPI001CA5B2DB|nr:hypothetical protein [Rhizobium populisoli]MBW6421208.1 hypothetical protein [Rhizobium populisoli]